MAENWAGKWAEHWAVCSVAPWVVAMVGLWAEETVVSKGNCSVALKVVQWAVYLAVLSVGAKVAQRAVSKVQKRADS